MSDRDELAEDLHSAGYTDANHNWRGLDIADVLIAAGWRKMPSREQIGRALYPNSWDDPDERARAPFRADGLAAADAILALMDGGSDDR
jgi:hypothetical protein